MIRARIADDMTMGGIAVLVEVKGDIRTAAHVDSNGYLGFDEQIQPGTTPLKPTLVMDDETAKALLDALARWYGGSGDFATLRQDYLHERGRVDKLTDALADVAGIVVRGPGMA